MNCCGLLFFKPVFSYSNWKKQKKTWSRNRTLGKGNEGTAPFACFLNIPWWLLMSCIIASWHGAPP